MWSKTSAALPAGPSSPTCASSIRTNTGHRSEEGDLAFKPSTLSQRALPFSTLVQTIFLALFETRIPHEYLIPQGLLDLASSGCRVLILLRGLPGSGKSSLAEILRLSLEAPHDGVDLRCAVHSADDFFVDAKGNYV